MNEEFLLKAFDAIDGTISSKVKAWERLLPKPVDSLPKFINFQKHLMHVIMSFLNEEPQTGSTHELFIQIPVEEFANKRKNDNLQIETFRKLISTVASCAFLSTQDAIEANIFISDENLSWLKEGSRYLAHHPDNGDRILICEKTETWPQIVKKADRNRGEIEIPNSLKDGLILFYENGKRPTLVSNQYLSKCDLYRLKGGSSRAVSRISKEAKVLKEISFLPRPKQYHNAKIVSIGKYFPNRDDQDYPIRSNYFNTVVFEKDIKDIDQSSKTDVIFVISDDRYKNRDHQRFLRRASKKIIYIGTEMPFENVKENTYPFTFRELYRYCSPNDEYMFTEPSFKEDIQFPWLDEKIAELAELINQLSEKDEELTESREDILECFRRIFSNMDFCSVRWRKKKQSLKDAIPGICLPETIAAISDWANNLSVPSISPKATYTNKNSLNIGRFDSYITKVKSLSGYNNNVVIDCASYSPNVNNAMYQAYRYVISHHFFANVTALYYAHERNHANRLRWFLAKELSYYQYPLRQKYGTSIDITIDEPKSLISLDDIEFSWEDDLNSWWSSDNQSIKVTFTDGSVVNIDGDILADIGEGEFETVSSSKLNKASHKGKSIYYYIQPDCFNGYKNAFALQGDVQKYSNKWKNALRQYYDIKAQKGLDRDTIIQQIESKTKINRSILSRHLDERCTNKFLMNKGHMKRMCRLLQECGLLNEDDITNIGKAQKAHFTTSTQLGKKIKEEVFLIKKCGIEEAECKTILLISDTLGISVEEIIGSCLQYGVIQDIEIIKK